jgi:DnaJ-class molecular chaperone
MADDPYQVLGVGRDATADAIKRAYRKLARQHHPDLNPDRPEAEERFKAIAAAHDLLSDPERRGRFDRGEIDAAGQESRAQGGGYRRHAETAAGERYARRPQADEFEDLFADLFTARRREAARPRRGEDETYRLAVPFLSAVLGATERLTLPDGRVLDVRIPPGLESGQILRLRAQGSPGDKGGPAGDALITIDVLDDQRFRRDGFDLRLDLPVTVKEAVLGGPVMVPAPAGELRVTLPPGSDGGRQIRLRGKGVAAHGDRPAGDLLLTLRIMIGPDDPALRNFLEEWKPATPFDPRAALGDAA